MMTGAFSPKVVAPGEGTTVKLFGVRFGYKVVSADSGGALAVMEVEIPAGTLVKPHSHDREDEFSLVLSGAVGVRIRTGCCRHSRAAGWSSRAARRTPCGTRPAGRPRSSRLSRPAGWKAISRNSRRSSLTTGRR